MQKTIFFLFLMLCFSCNIDFSKKMQHGVWLAQMQVKDNEQLPFNFEVTSDSTLKIFNADEVIQVNDISYRNDSVFIKMPVFEGHIDAKITDSSLIGHFIKDDLNRILPFKAEMNKKERFKVKNKTPRFDVSGKWETVFSPNTDDDTYMAVGLFKQNGTKVTGTFRTETGDYRYLEGVMDGDQLKLSTFDGSHAFLFRATVTDSTLEGTFYSGNHWKEPFVAKRSNAFELANPDSLTFLKEGYDTIKFSFPDVSGHMVSLSDQQFKDKVVVVQIMGTWCPNCLDETKFYSEFYKNNKDKGVEFIALAFEYAKTEDSAFKRIHKLVDDVGVEYPVLLAQYGTSDKLKAEEKLPMLNHILSYPTTIIMDKKGNVRKIHTGFDGPATGKKYMEFKDDFKRFIDELLME
ncbi:MAG: TlpA disulfide reductase family protein [Gelidibacter sp.]|nr:TlpA family protein disulfide reductase [Gelidibacter sp.]